MLKNLLLSILILFSLDCSSQYYFDFNESSLFYNKPALMKAAGYKKEVIIVKQLKENKLIDSFKVIISYFNTSGFEITHYTGSKWAIPVIDNSLEYKKIDSLSAIFNDQSKSQKIARDKKDDTYQIMESYFDIEKKVGYRNLIVKYEYDSVNRMKKIFRNKYFTDQKLLAIIYYDRSKRITKIDMAPESEKVMYFSYVYKNNKLKIYTVTQNSKMCNEKIKFNRSHQIALRKLDLGTNRSFLYDKCYYTYNDEGLVISETRRQKRKVFAVATHYYYK